MDNLNQKFQNKKNKFIKWGIVPTILIVVIAFFAFTYFNNLQTVNAAAINVYHSESIVGDNNSTLENQDFIKRQVEMRIIS